MREEGMEGMKSSACEEFEPRLMLFAAGELDASEIADVNEHLLHCSGCNLALAQENEMLALLASRHTEPDAALLASCRASLEDALDQQEERGWLRRTIGALLPFELDFTAAGVERGAAGADRIFGGNAGAASAAAFRWQGRHELLDRFEYLLRTVPGVVTADPASASTPSAGTQFSGSAHARASQESTYFPPRTIEPPQVQLQIERAAAVHGARHGE